MRRRRGSRSPGGVKRRKSGFGGDLKSVTKNKPRKLKNEKKDKKVVKARDRMKVGKEQPSLL